MKKSDSREVPHDVVGLLPERYLGLARGLGWAVMVVLPLGLYLPVIWFDVLLASDDTFFVVDRPTVQNWWSVTWNDRLLTPEVGYPIPVPTMVAALVHEWAGSAAYVRAMHVVSLALHLVNTVVAYFLARKILQLDRESIVPFLVVIAWTVHPVVVESVSWLTSLKNLMAGFGFLLAFLFWDRFLDADRPQTWLLTIVLIGVLLAVGSRPEAGLLPLTLAIWALFRTASARRRTGLILSAPAAVGGLAWSLFAKAQHDVFVEEMGTAPTVTNLGDRASMVVESVGFYLQRLAGLVPSNPLYLRSEFGDTLTFGIGLASLVVVLIITYLLWHTERLRLLGLLAVLALVYAPFSNIAPLPRFVSDAYLYLFGLLFLTFLAGFILEFFRSRRTYLGLLALWLVFVGLSLQKSSDYVPRWATTYRLWEPMAKADPSDPNPWYFMLYESVLRNDMERASQILERSEASESFQRNPPWFVPAVLDHAGRPEAAVESTKWVYRGAERNTRLARVTLDLLVKHARPINVLDDVDGFGTWVVRVYGEHPEWTGQRSPYGTTNEEIEQYLTRQGGDYLRIYRETRSEAAPDTLP